MSIPTTYLTDVQYIVGTVYTVDALLWLLGAWLLHLKPKCTGVFDVVRCCDCFAVATVSICLGVKCCCCDC